MERVRDFGAFRGVSLGTSDGVSCEAFRTVQRLARAAGIYGRVGPHSLRHAFATIHLDAGGALHDLQDSMGHADPRTTRRYDRARGNLAKSATHTATAVLDL